MLDQKHEQVHGVTFKPDCLPAPAQLVGAYIELEIAKADNWMRIRLRHSWYFGGAEILSCLQLQKNSRLTSASLYGHRPWWDGSISGITCGAKWTRVRKVLQLLNNCQSQVTPSTGEAGRFKAGHSEEAL